MTAGRASRTLRAVSASSEARVAAWTLGLAGSASLFALLTARWLGTEDRGVVVIFLTTASFLMLIGSLGLGIGGRHLLHLESPMSIGSYLSHTRALTTLHLVTSAVLGLGILAASNGLAHRWVAGFFVVYAVLFLASYFLRELLHGVGFHERAVMGDLIAALMQTALVVVLEASGHLTLLTTMCTLMAGALAQLAWLTWWCTQLPPQEEPSTWSLRRVARFSFPALLSSLGQAFVIRGDRLILGGLTGTSAVGIYGAAATFSEILWIVPGAVAQVSFRRAGIAQSADAGRRARHAALGVTTVMAVGLALAGPPIIDIFFGPDYAEATSLLWVLLVASLPMASYQLDVSVLNGLGRLHDASRATLASSGLLAILCLAFIPRWGALGAAYASLCAYSVLAATVRLMLRRN